MGMQPRDSGPRSPAYPPLSTLLVPRLLLSAQDEVRQTWALAQVSSWPASETVGAQVARGALMRVAQALPHLPVRPLLPNVPRLPQASSSGEEHTVGQEPGWCGHGGLPSQHPGFVGHRRCAAWRLCPGLFLSVDKGMGVSEGIAEAQPAHLDPVNSLSEHL